MFNIKKIFLFLIVFFIQLVNTDLFSCVGSDQGAFEYAETVMEVFKKDIDEKTTENLEKIYYKDHKWNFMRDLFVHKVKSEQVGLFFYFTISVAIGVGLQ